MYSVKQLFEAIWNWNPILCHYRYLFMLEHKYNWLNYISCIFSSVFDRIFPFIILFYVFCSFRYKLKQIFAIVSSFTNITCMQPLEYDIRKLSNNFWEWTNMKDDLPVQYTNTQSYRTDTHNSLTTTHWHTFMLFNSIKRIRTNAFHFD